MEKSQPWVPDVTFGEDKSSKRAKKSAENFALIHRLALPLLKSDTAGKAGLKRKRKRAGCNESYLYQLTIDDMQLTRAKSKPDKAFSRYNTIPPNFKRY